MQENAPRFTRHVIFEDEQSMTIHYEFACPHGSTSIVQDGLHDEHLDESAIRIVMASAHSTARKCSCADYTSVPPQEPSRN